MSTSVLSQKLKHYRKLHNMTQMDLAYVIGVAPEHIANIECGRKGISLEKLILICRHFNISLADILPIDEQDDSVLRGRWIDEIKGAIDTLNTTELSFVKTMVCALQIK